MSEASKAARAAMKSKAERLVRTDPKGTVDASGYTPPDALDADVKTGMRPISPRAFRKGGKVKGAEAHHHAGRKPRKAGGRALTPDSMINRNAKEANEERAGEKHVGALKRGGKAHRRHRLNGGETINDLLNRNPPPAEKEVPLPPPRPKFPHDTAPKENYMDPHELGTDQAKRGGKIHKSDGGPLNGSFYGNVLRPSKQAKGGKVEHDDEAMDKALIKKMVKPSARTGRDMGGALSGLLTSEAMNGKGPASTKALLGELTGKKHGGRAGRAKGGMAEEISGTRPTGGRTARAEGGATDKPVAYHVVDKHTGKVIGKFKNGPAASAMVDRKDNAYGGYRHQRVPVYADQEEERTARASGGRTGKGKTNVNIIIGQHPGAQHGPGGMMPPPAGPHPGMPIPMPPPPGPMQGPPGAPGAPGAPMPIPVPMGPPGGGMPPMGRARGGRTYPIHDGAGGGEGRLEKIAAYGLKPPKKG